jgi:endonuclease III
VTLAEVMDRLEALYGHVESPAPEDPYEFVVFLNSGYPASDENCARGFASLKAGARLHPAAILDVDDARLAALVAPGGMVPELRAQRLKEIALIVQDELGGDLEGALQRNPAKARRLLTKFPTLGEPAAERILLVCGLQPLAAAPAGGLQVLTRLGLAQEDKDFTKTYRSARAAIEDGTEADFAPRRRAYLLLKTHGHKLCRRSAPICDECPMKSGCAYALGREA